MVAREEPATLLTVEIDDWPNEVTQDRLLQCYNEVCDSLVDYVPKIVRGYGNDVADFKVQSPIIAQY